MRKIFLLLVCGLILAGAACVAAGYLWLREPPPEWTTRSPAALEEFELGIESAAKFYWPEARAHLDRALELDPDFAMAKLRMVRIFPNHPQAERWREALEAVDLEPLTPRERFLLRYWRADREGRGAEAEALLAAFLDAHPHDLWGLRLRCNVFWGRELWDEAASCYENLLEIHPNWVEARNRLGYIAMARGRFEESEEQFQTYRYVAPDQANPYHSMAELLTLLGRYDEAEEALRETIRIKPDFCAAYTLKAEIALMSGRLEAVEEGLRALESVPECEGWIKEGYACMMRTRIRYYGGDAEGAWRLLEEKCPERGEYVTLTAYRVAVMTGRLEYAERLVSELEGVRERLADRPIGTKFFDAMLAHMAGVRHAAEGDFSAAADRFREVDRLLGYWWRSDQSNFKLFNRVNLHSALERAGRRAEAETLRREIEAVNPRLLADIRLWDLETGVPAS